MKRQLLLARFAAMPWAMDPVCLQTMAGVLRHWAAGEEATLQSLADVAAAQEHHAAQARAARDKTAAVGGIALLPLYGVMAQRANLVGEISGGTSTQIFTARLREMLADDSVGGIIVDIDSPGGSVFGAGELAAELYQARQIKPVYGYINSNCASAAYWAGAQCAQLWITPGGQAGSIGVYVEHIDESAALAGAGYKPTLISAGKYKVEGYPGAPLNDEARAALQSAVDGYYAMFTRAVAKGRGVPLSAVTVGFGEGRSLLAADALAAGMVDGICSFDEVVSKMKTALKAVAPGPPGHLTRSAARRRQMDLLRI